MDNECQLDKGDLKQCCCDCVFLVAVNHHCTTEPTPTGKPREPKQCFCRVQKGWACTISMDDEKSPHLFDCWPQHSVGCEGYLSRRKYTLIVSAKRK